MTEDFLGCVWCGHRGEREVDFQGHALLLCQRHADHLDTLLGSASSENFMIKALERIVERRETRCAGRTGA